MYVRALVTVGVLALAVGCARRPAPWVGGRLHARAAIDAAEALGAANHPPAADHLQRAKAELRLVERLTQRPSGRAEGRLRERWLHRAEADAALALTLAREAPARAMAQDAADQLRAFEATQGEPRAEAGASSP